MTDILERLRGVSVPPGTAPKTIFEEAADEIERLQSQFTVTLAALESANDEVHELRAEVARLKAIIGYLEDHADIPISVRRDARRALESKP